MAGYVLYSLDAEKFTRLVTQPTRQQLTRLARVLQDNIENDEPEEDDGFPLPDDERSEFIAFVTGRLAMPDWYADLSEPGKTLWESVVFSAAMDSDNFDLGFRCDHDGVYWPVIEHAWKQLGVRPNRPSQVALAAFGITPFRCAAPDLGSDDEMWNAMHSMHAPEAVRQMVRELHAVAEAMRQSPSTEVRDDFEALLTTLETIASEGRMLFVQVDT